jgi:hypothetical protein
MQRRGGAIAASHEDRNQRNTCLALQLPFLKVSESMGNHDSKIVDAYGVD